MSARGISDSIARVPLQGLRQGSVGRFSKDAVEDVENGLPVPFPGRVRPPWPHHIEEVSMTTRRMESVGVVVEDLIVALAEQLG